MGCLSTQNFWFCFSLRAGGIFLGAMGLFWSIVASVYMYRNNVTEYSVVFVAFAFLFVLWLDGIQYKKPAWMFPIVVMWVIALWASIFSYMFVFYMYLTLPESKLKKFKVPLTSEVMLLGACVIVIIWDFAAVSYSLYRKIKNDQLRQTVISIVNQHHRVPTTTIPTSYPTIVPMSYPVIATPSPQPSAPCFAY